MKSVIMVAVIQKYCDRRSRGHNNRTITVGKVTVHRSSSDKSSSSRRNSVSSNSGSNSRSCSNIVVRGVSSKYCHLISRNGSSSGSSYSTLH